MQCIDTCNHWGKVFVGSKDPNMLLNMIKSELWTMQDLILFCHVVILDNYGVVSVCV